MVLEDIRSQFQVLGEALHGLREHMDRRFERVDERLDQVDRRLDQVDRRLDQVDSEIKLVKRAVLDLSAGLARVEEKVEEKVEKKVERDEVTGLIQEAVARPAH